MKRRGKLTLFSEGVQYRPPVEKTEVAKYRKSFGWMGEDYRQSKVADSLDRAIAKPEDFIPFPFRHISAAIVGGGSWKATEFPEKVLKKAVQLLSFKPAYANHEWEVSNIIGVNGQLKWSAKSKDKDGNEIPPGIDGPIWIDGLLHQDLTRKLSAYPVPHIQSVSVTVDFFWEPSHEFKNSEGQVDDYEFLRRIGSIADDGEMIRRIATEIIDGYETSLVWLGADPYAKILGEDNKPMNIEKQRAMGSSKFDEDPLKFSYERDKHYFVVQKFCVGEKIPLDLEGNDSKKNKKTENSNKNSTKMNEVVKYIAEQLGVDEEKITVDFLKGYKLLKSDDYTKLKDDSGKVKDFETVKKERDDFKTEKEEAADKVVKLEKIIKHDQLEEFEKEVPLDNVVSMAKFGTKTLKAKREACVKYYKLAVGENKAEQSVIDLINKANENEIEGLLKQYGEESVEKFQGKCEKCGSHEVTFRSTLPEGQSGEGNEGEEGYVPMYEKVRI